MNSRTQSKRRQNKTSTRVIQPLVHYTKYIGENYTKIDYTNYINVRVYYIFHMLCIHNKLLYKHVTFSAIYENYIKNWLSKKRNMHAQRVYQKVKRV